MAVQKKSHSGGSSHDSVLLSIISAGAIYSIFSVVANFILINIILFPLILLSLKGAALPGSFLLLPNGPLQSAMFALFSGFFYAAAYFFISALMPGRSGFSKGLYFGIFVWVIAVVPFLVFFYSLSQVFVGSVSLWLFDLLVRNAVGCSMMAIYLEKHMQ